MSGSNSSVDIQINIVDNNSAAAVQKVEQNIVRVGSSAISASASVSGMGDAIQTTARRSSQSFDGLGGSIQTVRLGVQELGLRVPRAMESWIAHNQMIASGLSSITGLMIGIGAAGIFVQLGEEAYRLYERWFDVTKAVEAYQQKAAQTAELKLINTADLETATAILKKANAEIDQLDAKKKAAGADQPGGGFGQYFVGAPVGHAAYIGGYQPGHPNVPPSYTAKDDTRQASDMLNAAEADARKTEDQHQQQTEALQQERAGLAGIADGFTRINAERSISIREAKLEHDQNIENLQTLQHTIDVYNKVQDLQGHSDKKLQQIEIPKDAGASQLSSRIGMANATADAASTALARQQANELIAIQNEARNANLQGEQLFQAQREEALQDWSRKASQIYGKTYQDAAGYRERYAAIEEKFDEESVARIQEQFRSLEAQERQADLAGKTGIPRANAAYDARIDEINSDPKMNDGVKSKARVDAAREHDAQLTEIQEQFNGRMQQLLDQQDGFMQTGYAKIEAAARKHVEEMQQQFKKDFGNGASQSQLDQEAKGETSIWAAADQERADLHQRTLEQIAEEERQTARDSISPWEGAQRSIIEQYEDRVAKAKDALDRELQYTKLSAQGRVDAELDYQRQVAAARQAEQLQMEKQMEQERDELAGHLQEFQKNPAQFLQKRAESAAFQVGANALMPAMQQSPELQWLFGMGKNMPVPGMGAIGGGGSTLMPAASQLTEAGTTLNSAGDLLLSAAQTMMTSGAGIPGAGVGGFSLSGAPGLYGFAGGGATAAGESVPDMSGWSSSLDNTTDGGWSSSLATQIPGAAAQDATALDNSGNSNFGIGAGLFGLGMSAYNAYSSQNPLTGALSGAMSGAALGTAILPGLGTAVGAVGGAVVGAVSGLMGDLFSDHGKQAAEDYDYNTLQPAILKEISNYNLGNVSYSQMEQDINQMFAQADQATQKMGSAARLYFNNVMQPEIQTAQKTFNKEMEGGRGNYNLKVAGTYHDGGWIGDGPMSSSERYIKAIEGEHITNARSAAMNAPWLDAINSGTNMSAVVAGMQRGATRSTPSSSGVEAHMHIHALDGTDVDRWLRNGGAMKIQGALNQAVRQYGGTALNERV